MELDFTRLNRLASIEPEPEKRPATMPQDAPEWSGQYKPMPEHEKPAEGLTDGERRLQREADRIRDEKQRTVDIFKEYQHNIKASGQLQTEILKGIKQGGSVYILFLKAAKAISLMTSDTVFYSQAEADIKAIYGNGLLEPVPLQMELDEVRGRLNKLRESETRDSENTDGKARIARAIKAHEARAETLIQLLDTAGQNRTV